LVQTERNFDFAWLESDRPFARPVPASQQRSRIRYFLDGSQQTLPGYHCAAIPILASITAAAILERNGPSDLRIMPDMIRMDRSWLVPKRSSNGDVQRFIECVDHEGFTVLDPLEGLSEAGYLATLQDYAAMEERALRASRSMRGKLELELLHEWQHSVGDGDDWIVIDGALRTMAVNAVGLVKSFTRQYVSGEHADQLFRLPAGYRSPAFLVEDKWRSGNYAIWYLRLWDSAGRDPRHSLVRIEVANPGISVDQIEAISGWILAERTPRATADSRWPTLLYPVHYLERILKRYMDHEMRYWPGVRATS